MRYLLAIVCLLCASTLQAARPERTILVVAASELKAADTAAIAVWGPSAKGSFSVGYCNDKSGKITHYVCSMPMSEKDLTVFKTLMDAQIKSGKAVAYEKAVRAKLKAEKFKAVKPDKPDKP
jgi:hypothetical protein